MRRSLTFLLAICLAISGCSGGGGEPNPTCSISGTIFSADNTAMPDVAVTLSGAGSARGTTDAGGHYIFSQVTAGTYTISAASNGDSVFIPVSRRVTVGDADITGVNFNAQPQQAFNPLKTGQETCYDAAGNTIACTGTGQDGEIWGTMPWPNPRFTDNHDQTMTDNLTNLMWTQNGMTTGPAVCDPGIIKTWQEALDHVECLNKNKYLGYNDWRLPNIHELLSLIDFEQSNPMTWLSNEGFSSVQSVYWSSTTTYANRFASDAYVGVMDYGSYAPTAQMSKSADSTHVWPVRTVQLGTVNVFKTNQTTCYNPSGGPISCSGTGQDGEIQAGIAVPSPRFKDNGDETITDNLTGLIWTKDGFIPGPQACAPQTAKSWQGALDYVKCLNNNEFLGYGDWRLPNVNELRSLAPAGLYETASWLNSEGFSNVVGNRYWTSSTSAWRTDYALTVSMGSLVGRGFYIGLKADDYFVWPVRAGR